MKRDLFFKALWISCFFMSCHSNSKETCSQPICLDVSLERGEEGFLVRLFFSSDVDTSLYLDEQMFIIGCPFYQENKSFFEGEAPALDELKFSQIILENERGNYRVFSSQLFDNEKPSVIMMPNCAFMGEKKVMLKSGQIETLAFSILEMQDILVENTDNHVRIHLYYKDSKGGGVLSSVSKLSVK